MYWCLGVGMPGVNRKLSVSTYGGIYMGADKSLARPDWKKKIERSQFSSDAEVIAAVETWLDEQPSEF